MAPQLEIHVNGKGTVLRKAERAHVSLTVSSTSTDQSKAFQDAQTTVSALTTNIRSLAIKTEDDTPHPSAAVTAFTVSPLSTTSQYQRDKDHRELRDLPKLYTVSASAEIIFRDMAQLGETSAELAKMPHVSVSGTEWRLTEATRLELEREARLKAIRDAVQKAQDYAGVVGRRVVAVEIRDGLASDGSNYRMVQQMPMYQTARQRQGDDGMAVITEGPSLEPKIITVSASVNAKFASVDDDE